MEKVENNTKNTKDNTKKRIILGSLIIVMSIVIIGLSISYAYYLNTIEEVNPSNQGTNITSGKLSMNFTTSQYINATAAGLINDEDVLDPSNSNYTEFSVSFADDNSVSSATYNLYLTEISMTQNFKNEDVKWALYNSSNSQIASGNFSTANLSSTANGDGTYNADDITLASSVTITPGTTNSYKLYIWLSNDSQTNQIDLLNGSLSAKVGFRATSGN